MQDLLNKIQDLLDVEKLFLEDKLTNFEEWDSLTMVALVSFAQKHYHINITLDALRACEKIQDICNLFKLNGGGGGELKTEFAFIANCFTHLRLKPHPSVRVA
ncbi:hypothetical protein BKH42_04915 [Helicobacter sp. 13S00482-2]|uniref:acyl carrier protein n=1 Tax=Helicobacter sp. 13S00482-2 TaxID=1476200 RepID=UPI000BA7B1CC|nr:acyl carrier protein [Helicobacter sp. 13S00482-2]PAF53664.1 hypothetical protein BKH42_04915 [Helicobacter sp. 13S00482-2]